jgi:hypothetical protein
MTTAEIVRERALSLAQAGAPTDQAVMELLESSGDHRVAVVVAEQELLAELDATGSEVLSRAVELLDQVLERMPSD